MYDVDDDPLEARGSTPYGWLEGVSRLASDMGAGGGDDLLDVDRLVRPGTGVLDQARELLMALKNDADEEGAARTPADVSAEEEPSRWQRLRSGLRVSQDGEEEATAGGGVTDPPLLPLSRGGVRDSFMKDTAASRRRTTSASAARMLEPENVPPETWGTPQQDGDRERRLQEHRYASMVERRRAREAVRESAGGPRRPRSAAEPREAPLPPAAQRPGSAMRMGSAPRPSPPRPPRPNPKADNSEALVEQARVRDIEIRRLQEEAAELARTREDVAAARLARIEAEVARMAARVRARRLHGCLSAWRREWMRSRVELEKLGEMARWRCQLRCFRAWLQEMVASQAARAAAIQEERQLRDQWQMASAAAHRARWLAATSLARWRLVARALAEERRDEAEARQRRDKMSRLLEAAAARQVVAAADSIPSDELPRQEPDGGRARRSQPEAQAGGRPRKAPSAGRPPRPRASSSRGGDKDSAAASAVPVVDLEVDEMRARLRAAGAAGAVKREAEPPQSRGPPSSSSPGGGQPEPQADEMQHQEQEPVAELLAAGLAAPAPMEVEEAHVVESGSREAHDDGPGRDVLLVDLVVGAVRSGGGGAVREQLRGRTVESIDRLEELVTIAAAAAASSRGGAAGGEARGAPAVDVQPRAPGTESGGGRAAASGGGGVPRAPPAAAAGGMEGRTRERAARREELARRRAETQRSAAQREREERERCEREVAELRRRERLERQGELRRQQEERRLAEQRRSLAAQQVALARCHAARALVVRRGWAPWRALVAAAGRSSARAAAASSRLLLRRAWRGLFAHLVRSRFARVMSAVRAAGRAAALQRVALLRWGVRGLCQAAAVGRFRRSALSLRAWRAWLGAVDGARAARMWAARRPAWRLRRLALREWRVWAAEAMEARALEELHRRHDEAQRATWAAAGAALRAWRQQVLDARMEREKESRIGAMRRQVDGWLAELRDHRASEGSLHSGGGGSTSPRSSVHSACSSGTQIFVSPCSVLDEIDRPEPERADATKRRLLAAIGAKLDL